MSVGYLAALIAGAALGVLFRSLPVSQSLRRSIADWADFVAIRVLLPFHVLLSTQVMSGFPMSLFIALLIGCGLPLVCYGVGRMLASTLHASVMPSLPLVAATFGGGNRGILLLSLLMAFHIPTEFHSREGEATLYDFFAVMDLAYFLVFLTIVPELHYATTKSEGERRDKALPQLFSAAVVLLSFVLSFVGERVANPQLWAEGRMWLGYSVTLICTALVVVHARFEFSTGVFRSIGVILVSRAAGIGILLVGLVLFSTDTTQLLYLAIPLSVFLLVPPSSYVPSIISRYEERDAVERAATLAVSWNLVYLVMVAGVAFAGLVRVLTSLPQLGT